MLVLIFTRSCCVVVHKIHHDWRELQDQFEGYMTSLDFADAQGLLEWWQEEYAEPVPQALLDFLDSNHQECQLEVR